MNQIKYGVILSYISLALNNVVTILYTPFLLHYLGKSEYGLYSLVSSIIAYLTVMDLGLGNTIVRYAALYKSEHLENKLYDLFGLFLRIYIIISVLAAFLGAILYFRLDDILGGSLTAIELYRIKIMFIITLINLIITFPLSVFISIVTAFQKFIFQKSVNIIRIILQPLIMIPLLMVGYKAIALVLLMSILNIGTLLCNMFYCFKVLRIKITFGSVEKKIIKEVFIFASFVFLGVFVDKVNWSTGQILLGIYSGPEEVALYAVAIQILLCYFGFASSMSGIFLPRITELINDRNYEKQLSFLFIKIGRLQYIILLLVFLGFVFYGKQFILYWAGNEYVEAYYMSLIIMLPLTFVSIQHSGVLILQALNKQKVRSVIYFIISILNILISCLLIRYFDSYGCAISLACCMTVGNLVIMNYYYKTAIHIDINKFWINIVRSVPLIAVMIIMGLIMNMLFPVASLKNLILKILVFTVTYMFFSYFLYMNTYEKSLMQSFVKRIKR